MRQKGNHLDLASCISFCWNFCGRFLTSYGKAAVTTSKHVEFCCVLALCISGAGVAVKEGCGGSCPLTVSSWVPGLSESQECWV